jgi:signal transduction histidine kinase
MATRRRRGVWRWVGLLLLALAGCSLDERPVPGVVALRDGEALAVGAQYPEAPPAADAPWQPVTLPDAWDSRRPDYQGYVWYRLRFPGSALAGDRLALYLPSVSMNARVLLNGEVVGQPGRMREPVTRNFYTPLIFAVPRPLLRTATDNELLVLVMGYRQYRSGLAPIHVGDAEPLQRAWAARHFWQNTGTLITSVLVLGLAVYGGLLWARSRRGGMYAWFTVATLVWGLRNLNFVLTDHHGSNLWWNQLSLIGAAAFVALFVLFVVEYAHWVLRGPAPARWQRAVPLAYLALSIGALMLTTDTAQLRRLFLLLALGALALAAWSQWTLFDVARRARGVAVWAVAIAGLVYLLLMLHDYGVAADREQLGQLFLRQYAALPLFLAVTLVWTQRYWQAFGQVERLSRELKQQVDVQRAALDRNVMQLMAAERERVLSQERERLVSDLHDGLGLHLLTALKLVRSGPASREALAETLQDCLDELRVAIDSMSNIDERDPVLLLASLRFRLAPRLNAAGVQLDWQVDGEIAPQPWLDAPNALHLLRVVQEALTNAVRHGGATRVLLKVAPVGDGVAVSVIDNGRGFDRQAGRGGLGLASMHKRAAMIGATVSVEGRPQGGTRVSLVRPVAD